MPIVAADAAAAQRERDARRGRRSGCDASARRTAKGASRSGQLDRAASTCSSVAEQLARTRAATARRRPSRSGSRSSWASMIAACDVREPVVVADLVERRDRQRRAGPAREGAARCRRCAACGRASATPSSSVVSAPPSPAVMPLRPWKLKQAMSARLPAGRAPVRRARGAGGVLHQPQAVPVGDRPQLVVVGRLTERVDGDDADGARGDRRPRPRPGRRSRCPAGRRRRPASRRSSSTAWPVAGNV